MYVLYLSLLYLFWGKLSFPSRDSFYIITASHEVTFAPLFRVPYYSLCQGSEMVDRRVVVATDNRQKKGMKAHAAKPSA